MHTDAAERIGVVGLGYVGLPLALCFVERGGEVFGVDLDKRKATALAAGNSYLRHLPSSRIAAAMATGRLHATDDFSSLSSCSAIIICVPTPLTAAREPDLSFIEKACRAIAPHMRAGQMLSLESTTYPGTTRDVMRPILERGSGLTAGKDFALVFSPEREDPGNARYSTANIPKVVGGFTTNCLERGIAVYRCAVDRVVPVSSLEAAEMTKLLENIFRSVNIALVNELKVLCHRFTDAAMPVDINEVIEAASTKPFGYTPFYPGPGLGGHCIPIDPFYLTWKAREVDTTTRFIELAGEINTNMPYYVVDRLMRALSDRHRPMRGARVLVVGAAYKADVDDMRESPSLKLMKLLMERGALVTYHDPHVTALTPEHGGLELASVELSAAELAAQDAVLVATAHTSVDYELIAQHAPLVIDTRNVMRRTRIAKERLISA